MLKSLRMLQNLNGFELIRRALVIFVDREGGRLNINLGGNAGSNDISSVPFTLKVRLLTNFYNNDASADNSNIGFDEYYALPLNSPNIIDIPEKGEIVNVI